MNIGYPIEKDKNDGFSPEGKVLLVIFILTIIIGTIVITATRTRRIREALQSVTTADVTAADEAETEETGQ